MSEGLKIALTALAGISVFVVGQIIQKLFIEPIQEQRKLKAKLVHVLATYGFVNPLLAPKELLKESKDSCRELAAELQAATAIIPFNGVLGFLHIVPKEADIQAITTKLGSLSDAPSIDEWTYIFGAVQRAYKIQSILFVSDNFLRKYPGPKYLGD